MKICANDHPEIVYNNDECPMCKEREILLEGMVSEMQGMVKRLRDMNKLFDDESQ